MSVMNTKMGQKTWADNRTQPLIEKTDGIKRNSAADLQQLGDQEIGDVLNQIADPNYVDPKKVLRAVGNDKLDKDAFMKLMLAQMKNQDPTNPLKSHEMAAQLAQFTSLEQLQNMNTTLGEIHKGQKPAENFQMLNLIGKSVSGDSAKMSRLRGDQSHDFNFDLPEDAKDVTIKVRNEAGEDIRKVSLHDFKKGKNMWTWNGKAESGATAPVGEYQYVIEAKGKNDKKLAVKTDFSGVISGVSYSAEGPILMVGNQTIKMKDIRKVLNPQTEPTLQTQQPGQKDQKLNPSVAQDLNKMGTSPQTEEKPEGAAEAKTANVMTDVSMSSGMMEKLKKEIR